ncbi:MAG TPA: HAD family phosphatase [Cyclobacteriaceae bacterium]|nr:HAD family phosphatase [Cyclobacteriaceae bacterium]
MFAFVFDMDGVIVDTNPYHKIALKQFAEKYGYHLDEEGMVKKIYGRTNKEWIPNLFGKELTAKQLEQYGEEKEKMFRDLYKKDITPVPGLREFLNGMDELKIPRAIGTSAPKSNLDFIVDELDIRKFFSVTLHEADVTRGKPDPEVYVKCAARLNMPTSQCIVFEDSLSGVAAARAAGCPVVGVATTHTAEELGTKVTIKDFTEKTPSEIIKVFEKA